MKKFTQADVDSAADLHKTWLESEGAKGQKVDFSYLNLSGLSLNGFVLTSANLRGAILHNTELRNVCLTGADLSLCDLRGATLRGTILHEALLCDADMSEAVGLQSHQLAGADISGAKLPTEITEGPGINLTNEASKNARFLLLIILLACAYCWLTIFDTSDAELLADSSTSTLPVIGTDVPIVAFFFAAPSFLFVLYLYFHLHLYSYWKALSRLPAVFPDGRTLDERTYPWVMTSIIRSRAVQQKESIPIISNANIAVSLLIGWWIVPITLFLFWTKYIITLNSLVFLHVLLIASSLFVAVVSDCLSRKILSRKFIGQLYNLQSRAEAGTRFHETGWRKAFHCLSYQNVKKSLPDLSISGLHLVPPVCIVSGIIAVSVLVLYTNLKIFDTPLQILHPYADVESVELSTKLPDWTEGDLSQVTGIDLRGSDLRRASARGVFLSKANLEGANLKYIRAQEAMLNAANLFGANFQGAELHRANFSNSDVRNGMFQGANLQDANFFGAKLHKANFSNADLSGADLRGAILEGAILDDAHLDDAQLEGAILISAQFQRAHLKKANLRCADLSSINLSYADLSRANLDSVNLENAELIGATLNQISSKGANFFKAEMMDANLTSSVLNGSRFESALLNDALLVNAQLKNTDFDWANLSRAQLDGANYQGATFKGTNVDGTKIVLSESGDMEHSKEQELSSDEGFTDWSCSILATVER